LERRAIISALRDRISLASTHETKMTGGIDAISGPESGFAYVRDHVEHAASKSLRRTAMRCAGKRRGIQ
jgi:hypothetical protein